MLLLVQDMVSYFMCPLTLFVGGRVPHILLHCYVISCGVVALAVFITFISCSSLGDGGSVFDP